MKTFLIGDFSNLTAEQTNKLIQRVENSDVTAVRLESNSTSILPWASVSYNDITERDFKSADEYLIVASDSDAVVNFIESNKEFLVAANAQVISFEGEEDRQNKDIETLKHTVETLTSQVASLADELSKVKLMNTAILGCLPEEQRQQIEAAASHMQANASRTMSLVREFVNYLTTLSEPTSIEEAVSGFSEKLGVGEQLSDMVLGTLENVVDTEDYTNYISKKRQPVEIMQEADLSKAMIAAYASIISTLNA